MFMPDCALVLVVGISQMLFYEGSDQPTPSESLKVFEVILNLMKRN
jgi:hypothetical protein